MGGDIHYFGPIEFEGDPSDYDLADICGKFVLTATSSPNKARDIEVGVEEAV